MSDGLRKEKFFTKMTQPLKFYDLKEKKAFTSNDYKIENRNGRKFAVAHSPTGTESWKAVSKDFNEEGEN